MVVMIIATIITTKVVAIDGDGDQGGGMIYVASGIKRYLKLN